MSNFEDDLARGCLETGEPLECLYGMGWWSEIPEEEPVEPEPKVCEACGGDGSSERFTVHSDIERQDDKSPNDTQSSTIVYGKESEE